MLPVWTVEKQEEIEKRLDAHTPEFAAFTTAVLFPTGSSKCFWVDVPVRLGLDRAESAADLDITPWIPPGSGSNASSINQHAGSVTVTHWPFDESEPLTRAYTIFFAPQPLAGQGETADTHPPSLSINHLVPALAQPWRGNVLVVRSAPRHEQDGVYDMTEKDTYQVKAILRRVIREGLAAPVSAPCSLYPNNFMYSPIQACTEPSVAISVLAYCPWPDFINFTNVNKTARVAGKALYFHRILRRLCHVLLPPDTDFLHKRLVTYTILETLLQTDSGIVGSIVLALMTFAGAEDDGVSIDNMNLLAPYSYVREWRELLQCQLGFHYIGQQEARPEYAGHLTCLLCFTRGQKYITVSATTSASILPALFASRCTSQMNLLVHDRAYTFYPHLTSERTSLLAWPATTPSPWVHDYLAGRSPLAGSVSLRRDTSQLHRPCRRECSRIWRSVRGLRGVGQYMYGDGIFDEETFGQHLDLLWRIGNSCRNTDCAYKGPDLVLASV